MKSKTDGFKCDILHQHLKTSVVIFYSIVPSTYSYDDSHSTEEILD